MSVFLTIYYDILDKVGRDNGMRLREGLRQEKEYFKQKQYLTGCGMEHFLLSQVLAKASKLKSMCGKDLHILKKGAKEIP